MIYKSKNGKKLLLSIEKAKNILKNNKIMNELFKEYQISIDEMQFIPTFFKKMDVSAKTSKGIVYLNYDLLDDRGELPVENYSYLIHEYCHWLQQTTGTKPTKGSDDESYLDNENEQEGFQHQIRYIDKMFGEEEAEKYTDDLLEYHDKSEKEKKELKDKLMSKI